MMMCQKTLFNPTGPCCGATSFCGRWPEIDWNRYGWLVRMPAANWEEVRYANVAYPGSPTVVDGSLVYAYNATAVTYPEEAQPGDTVVTNTLHSWHAYHIPGGEYVSSHSGSCRWSVLCRERLCPDRFSLMTVDKLDVIWFVCHHHFVPYVREWTGYRAQASSAADPIEGPFVQADGDFEDPFGDDSGYINWRHIIRAAECSFFAELSTRGLTAVAYTAIEGGLLARVSNARSILRSLGTSSANIPSHSFYRPTALDLAVAWTLSGGISFGIESDPRSEYFGQFAIFEGGTFDSDDASSWLTSTPWQLTSGNEVIAALGAVNRFERTDSNDTLPEYLELELVRI